MKSFKRHISVAEKLTAVFIWALFLTTLGVRLFFGGELTVLLVIFAVCAAVFTFLLLTPLRYDFGDDQLLIVNKKPLKDRAIPYKAVIKCDTIGSFRHSKWDINAGEVLITYKPDGERRKKTVCCHPQKVDKFVKLLQDSCPYMEYDPD